jgi:PPOX class probable F420-dependent enzyme
MSSRSHVTMTPEEVRTVLEEPLTLTVSTLNADGTLHAVPVFYGFLGDELAFHSKSRSQKVVNLRRNSSITVSAFAGDDPTQLRGVMIVGRAAPFDDEASLRELNRSIVDRYTKAAQEALDPDRVFEANFHNRVGMRVIPLRVISFDHSKVNRRGATR